MLCCPHQPTDPKMGNIWARLFLFFLFLNVGFVGKCFKSLFDLQIKQMTLYSTYLIMNEAYKSLVLAPNSAPSKYLIGKKKEI